MPTTISEHSTFGDEKTAKKLSEEELRLLVESGYSQKAIALYVNNVNVGKLEPPSIFTTFLGPCGDLIKLYLKIGERDRIEDATFYYLGCPGSAVAASALTQLIKGKTVNQAKRLKETDILIELGGLPKSKLDCAKLSIKTLQKALAEYEKQKGRSEL